ncbi:MAG TPA: hypothetical protein VMC84_06615 [Methanocella sp.]|uniref:hypothetical protein n=1 Tax=Methanocella sp. TaxID=2052833 RepID=UPI002BAAE99A|nr:hypothetical protein [Methanocella sp.]HTY90833.1 hypothetical protein [Methanocella sp.]
MEPGQLQPPEKYYILTLEQYLSLINSEKVGDCYSALQHLSMSEHFRDKKIIVRTNVAELIRERYHVSRRAFYAANRFIEFTPQTTLDVEGP